MKRDYVSVAILCAILMLNITFTQFMVHQYFYGHYANTIISGAVNILLFPAAIFIYKRDQKMQKGIKSHE